MLEKKVGAGRFLLVVTSTGYTDDEITDFSKYRIPTGTFSVTRASALLNMYLMAVYGQGQYVETEFGSQLFLNQKLIEDKQLNLSDVLTRAQAFLIQMAGVKDVYTSQRLALSAGETEIRRLRNSFNQMLSLIHIWNFFSTLASKRPVCSLRKGVCISMGLLPSEIMDWISVSVTVSPNSSASCSMSLLLTYVFQTWSRN